MSWLFFAILAPVIYAVNVYIDKYILEKKIADYSVMPIYGAIVAFIFGIFIWVATGFPLLSATDTIFIIITGIFTAWGLASYFKALADDEASKVTILFQMTPIITLLLSYFVLGDKISAKQLVGFLLILISTVGVSLNLGAKLKEFRISNVFFLILLTDFLWATAFVLFKFVVEANSFTKVVSYESFGIALGGLMIYLFFSSVRQAFGKNNSTLHRKVILFIAINEAVFLAARLLTYLAISKGPVALVDVVGGTQVFFAIIYGLILTLIAPKVFKEDITGGGLIKKISMAVLVFLGLWLIAT